MPGERSFQRYALLGTFYGCDHSCERFEELGRWFHCLIPKSRMVDSRIKGIPAIVISEIGAGPVFEKFLQIFGVASCSRPVQWYVATSIWRVSEMRLLFESLCQFSTVQALRSDERG